MLYSRTLALAASLTARSPHAVSMHGSQPDEALVAATQRWVDGVIVAHNLCPFAAAVRPHTRYVVCRAHTMETFEAELRRLDAVDPAKAATTLVLLPGDEFAAFADLMDLQPDVQELADELQRPHKRLGRRSRQVAGGGCEGQGRLPCRHSA